MNESGDRALDHREATATATATANGNNAAIADERISDERMSAVGGVTVLRRYESESAVVPG
jgi:hypothetical protein